MSKHVAGAILIAGILIAVAVAVTPVSGQHARGVTVICGNCELTMAARDGRSFVPVTGSVLRNDATGDLWFYTLGRHTPPVRIGTLMEVGQPIDWAIAER